MYEKMNTCLQRWRGKQQNELLSQDLILFVIQIILIPLLSLSILLFSLVDTRGYHPLFLVVALLTIIVLSAAMLWNINGRHTASLLITLATAFIVPWIYAIYGVIVLSGPVWLLLFLSVSVQILSLLATLRVVIPIATLQVLGMACLVARVKTPQAEGWIILFFTVMVSVVSIATNQLIRQQHDKIISSISDSAATERTLRDYSTHDPLTGLYNRRFLEEALRNYTKTTAQSFAIMMVDLDHFKSINDLYGHVVGDTVLQQVSSILSVNHRPTDVACRYGGDEFIMILIGCSLKDAIRKAETIKQQIAALTPLDREEHRIMVTASIGVAHFPENGGDRDTILKIVDQTLYMAKQEGRNKVVAALAST